MVTLKISGTELLGYEERSHVVLTAYLNCRMRFPEYLERVPSVLASAH